MVYRNNGYIIGFSNSDNTDEENSISEALKNAPTPPQGYGCRLKEDLTWELFELPTSTETDNEATEADYINALEELGVSFDG